MTRDLTIKDWPMFDRVVRDPKACAMMLEAILGIEVGRIEYIDDEHAEKPSLGGHGVRMDVFAKADGAVYDIEMQTTRELSLMRRMRYYQAVMDAASLPAGTSYAKLPESYVIFICDHDPFARSLPRYTLEHTCREDEGIEVASGMHWVVLSAPAWEHAEDERLSHLLRYIHTGRVEGDLAITLEEQVRHANAEEAWKEQAMGFMTLEMDALARMDAAREEGYAHGEEAGERKGRTQGISESQKRMSALIAKLSQEGRLSDLGSVADDPDALEALMADNGI